MKQKVIYYSDELNDEFSSATIKARKIDENYKYGDESFWWNLKRFIAYRLIAVPLSYVLIKINYHHKIVNKKILKEVRNKNYFIYANHTNQMCDPFIPAFVCSPSYIYVIVHPNNISIPIIGPAVTYLGALPLPDTLGATKNFVNIIKERVMNNYPIVIYPEAHIWPFYTKIRPFGDASFRFPIQYNSPVYCFTNTYQKRRFSKKPKMVTYIDGPFYADKTLSLKEQRSDLRNKVYNVMCERSKNNNVEIVKYIKKESEK